MSWIVENTLHRYDYIKNNLEIDSDAYLDLIAIDGAIDELTLNNKFRANELRVIHCIKLGYYYIDVMNIVGISRHSVNSNFRSACAKIAEHLGGAYTEEGYEKYMTDKYSLTEDEVSNLKKFVSSRFRHR